MIKTLPAATLWWAAISALLMAVGTPIAIAVIVGLAIVMLVCWSL